MANRKRTDLGVVHVSATPPGWNKGVAGLRAMHKAQGWKDVGYNQVLNPDGRVQIGRGLEAIGAHVAGFNSIAFGLVMVGGVDARGRPDFSTVQHLLPQLEQRMWAAVKRWPGIEWCGHRDLSPDKDGDGIIEPYEWMKACPCFDVIPWARSRGLPVADIKGTWKAEPVLPGAPVVAYIGPNTRDAYLQRLLLRAGYAFGPVDGIVGPRTKAAIRAYQSVSGLKVTGTFDTATVARLRATYEGGAAALAA